MGRLTAFLLAASMVLPGCAPSDEGRAIEDIFVLRCTACHRADGAGVGAALGPGSPAAAQSDGEMADVIRNGRGTMQGFGDRLTDEQIDGLVAYIRALQNP